MANSNTDSNVSVLSTLGAGIAVGTACGAQVFARSCQALEHVATSALAGSIVLEQYITDQLSAENLAKLNEEIAKTTILK